MFTISARFPSPCQNRSMLRCFFECVFRYPFWWPQGGPRASQGGRFESLFHTFGVPCRVPLFGIDFSTDFRLPEGGKKLCFLSKGCQKSMFGLSRKCAKNHLQNGSILVPFWHQMADFGGIQKSIKNCTPKVWHMVPKAVSYTHLTLPTICSV